MPSRTPAAFRVPYAPSTGAVPEDLYKERTMKRIAYLAEKLFSALLVVFCIVTVNFFLVRFMPGDVVMHIVGEDEYLNIMSTNPEKIEEIRAAYGLDADFFTQFVRYLKKTAALDFGSSFRTKAPVLDTILFRGKWTLYLALPTIVISGLIGGFTGLLCGWGEEKWYDRLVTRVFLLVNTIPSNCLAILFLIAFAFRLKWFPIGGITSGGLSGWARTADIFRHIQLPLIVLILYRTASNHMLMRSTVTQLHGEQYIDTALSKGLTERLVRSRHLLKNALSPYITSLCMQLGGVFAGSMMVEVVFSWKGMGSLIYESVNAKDFPMLQGCFLLIGVCVVAFNLLSDVLYAVIDPRVKDGEHEKV